MVPRTLLAIFRMNDNKGEGVEVQGGGLHENGSIQGWVPIWRFCVNLQPLSRSVLPKATSCSIFTCSAHHCLSSRLSMLGLFTGLRHASSRLKIVPPPELPTSTSVSNPVFIESSLALLLLASSFTSHTHLHMFCYILHCIVHTV